jgi:hypothetical protein
VGRIFRLNTALIKADHRRGDPRVSSTASLSPNRQQHLNNSRETWAAYLEDRRKLGDPEAKPRPAGRHHRQFPSLLEQIEALAEQLELANERAERESAYFWELMQEVAARAKLDEDDIAEIRAKVRAAHAAGDSDAEPNN